MSSAWNNVFQILIEALSMPFSYLTEPHKRIHYLYLGSSLLLAFWVYKKQDIRKAFLSYLLPKSIWMSKSTGVDVALLFVNSFVKVLLVSPLIIYGYYLAYWVNEYLVSTWGYTTSGLGEVQVIVLYTISLTVISDFASYVTHYLMHRVPLLWEFHKTHHSATSLNPLTQYRLHPVELIINNIRNILVIGFVTGLFNYLSMSQIDKLTFLGVNVFSFTFLFFGANLRHSHVKLSYFNWLEYCLISPFQHQIHHSNEPDHFNKNMGAKFAIWDWIFGTLKRSRQVSNLQFGLGEEDKHYDTPLKNLLIPFWMVYESTTRLLKR